MAMDANTEMVAPPSTHCGIVVRSAENFGTNPASRIIPAASPNTTRFTTFVVATIPTFWLNVAVGNPPKKEPKIFVIPFIVIGTALLFMLRWRLNILSLHEDEAKALGINVKKYRLLVMIASTMTTASCVSMCGQVGWVGLLIPHVARMIYGSDNKKLIPACIGIGATFMVIIDTMARSATAAEIPVSILTALIGAPFFVLLLRKTGGAKL